jgi:hypothetical protein
MHSRTLLSLCIAIVLGACSRTPNPIPIGADTYYYGNLVSGERFGVDVGYPDAAARRALAANHWKYVGEFECDYTLKTLFACRTGERYGEFTADRFWRHGSVYLKIEGNQVRQIGWSFSLLPYIDT